MKRVETLTLQNRLHEAAKILTSHGPASPSLEGLDRLRALHPALKEEIPELSTDAEQFTVTKSRAAKILFPLCGSQWGSLDPFGWSTALLHLIRAAKPDTEGQE